MTVSQQEGQCMAQWDANRLYRQQRLSLVLDLDHTLVHATSDIRAQNYLRHNTNNNNKTNNNTSAAGVRTIRLPLNEGTTDPLQLQQPSNHLHHQQQQWAQHYVKLRPHVNDLLRGIESTYEVSVYTAGTKQCAEEVTKFRRGISEMTDASILIAQNANETWSPTRYYRLLNFPTSQVLETTGLPMQGCIRRTLDVVDTRTMTLISEIASAIVLAYFCPYHGHVSERKMPIRKGYTGGKYYHQYGMAMQNNLPGRISEAKLIEILERSNRQGDAKAHASSSINIQRKSYTLDSDDDEDDDDDDV
ncbi:NLI interacting factor-like phosphatase [Nitzschia inconspicua]|uniref:protein-serine/threonine phosphatase n=1 Tax=Nitzschia inconspicua TaxID=303405 RepID=A0A9K3PQ75_9STRA|nr:NLI interacting factor-like phosphatase [Nitzschia inconspicua]